ncbi:MAG: diguanylate cyclase [Gammaproteobacteria bacterium]|nr:diguanylate cyclase [Gammaproteobacteria bacterium]MDX2460049.1 diguanylate cyclase [Gammaproteobacteria bacterium]
MPTINPLIRITLGLVSVTLILVFVGDYVLQLTRDQSGVDFRQREKISKTLVLQFSPLAEINDTNTIGKAMEALVERNRDVMSTALRGSDGKIITSAGNHEQYWSSPGAGVTTVTHADMPLMVGGREWGTVEVSFAPKRGTLIPFLSVDPLLSFLLFITGSACLGYFFFMKRTLTHLDPKAVIPDKVKSTLDLLAEGVVLIDVKDNIVLANLTFADKLGVDPSVLIGKPLSALRWRSPGSSDAIEKLPWATAMKDGTAQTDFPVALTLEEDNVLVFASNSSPILDSNLNLRGAMATFNDETALQEANGVLLEMMDKLRKSQDEVNKQNTELMRLATRDPMTNCLNRRSFFERMDKAFMLAQSEKNAMACVMVDIDHFKKINDDHGHGVGDKVLKMVAKLLDSKFGNKDSICRYGGEEFCVLMPGTGLDKAIEVAQEVRATIESYATMGIETDGEMIVTASLGVSALEQGASSPGLLVDQADLALYQAKETGRNRVEQWSQSLTDNRAA